MLGVLRRSARAGDPSPAEAFEALSQGLCLYARPERACSPRVRAVGLRHEFDGSDVLVCSGHYGRLRRLEGRRLDELERVLTEAFSEERRWVA